jgi:hypothetical protein
VLGFNANGSGGFLLRHSVPRFPAYKKDGYNGFPDYARIYGQTMICVTLGTSLLHRTKKKKKSKMEILKLPKNTECWNLET